MIKPTPDDGIPDWDRARLTKGLQTCDSRVLSALYAHFRPILVERAALFGIPRADVSDAVETFLGDMLLRLCSGKEIPHSLHNYMFVAFKRYAGRMGMAHAAERSSLEEFHGNIVRSPAVFSEPAAHYLTDVQGPEPDSGAVTPESHPLFRFAHLLISGLSDEEKLILSGRAEEMPLREIAALLGVNYNAANTRLSRLRSRLKADAARIAARMDADDRRVVERFLRRAREGLRLISSTANTTERSIEQRRLGNE